MVMNQQIFQDLGANFCKETKQFQRFTDNCRKALKSFRFIQLFLFRKMQNVEIRFKRFVSRQYDSLVTNFMLDIKVLF